MVKYVLLSALALSIFAVADGYIDATAKSRVWDMWYAGEITEDVLFDTLTEIGRY